MKIKRETTGLLESGGLSVVCVALTPGRGFLLFKGVPFILTCPKGYGKTLLAKVGKLVSAVLRTWKGVVYAD